MLEFLKNLDRRWVFLLMGLAVTLPLVFRAVFPENPSPLAVMTFEQIEQLPPGSRILLSFDYDPASEGELGPMATSFVRHCVEKRHKLYFMALWPLGAQMIEQKINAVIIADYNQRPEVIAAGEQYEYGADYINLGYKAGNEGVIKVIVTDFAGMYTTDVRGNSLGQFPIMHGVDNVRQMDLIINVSAGQPGTKEWVQYAATAYPGEIRLVAGCTGVQAPLLYPYIPQQLPGLLGAIKGAAEYEFLVNEAYQPENVEPLAIYTEALRRMAPQLVAHLLIIGLIIMANIIYFVDKSRGGGR